MALDESFLHDLRVAGLVVGKKGAGGGEWQGDSKPSSPYSGHVYDETA